MARIGLYGVQVVKADSHGEVSSTSMTLNAEELKLLVEGYHMVDEFWHSKPLPKRGVLLACGCIVDWDKYNADINTFYQEKDAYKLPYEGDKAWCNEHEDTRVYRFNVADFTEE